MRNDAGHSGDMTMVIKTGQVDPVHLDFSDSIDNFTVYP